MKKLLSSFLVLLSSLFFFTPLASAHVIVTPSTVGIGSTQTFDVSVPSEKDNPTVSLQLMVPDGLQEVSPTIVAGWTINVQQSGTGDSAKVTEIDWTGGSIPPGERADFTFRAQAPSQPTKLQWKAIQTYSDGTTVSWTQDPVPGHEEDDSMTPYSVTQVVNDLTPKTAPTTDTSPKKDNSALALSVAAILISAVALGLNIRRQS